MVWVWVGVGNSSGMAWALPPIGVQVGKGRQDGGIPPDALTKLPCKYRQKWVLVVNAEAFTHGLYQ